MGFTKLSERSHFPYKIVEFTKFSMRQKTGVSVLCGLINLIPAMQKILDHDMSLYEESSGG